MKDATGGGDVTGGGDSYEVAPEPVACGQWVPAPVATGEQPPANAPAPTVGPDTPPEPIAGPEAPGTAGTGSDVDAANGPAATTATTPASQLATWPQWQQHFTRLGLGADEVAKLGSANLTDAQLAQVYEKVHGEIVAAGGVPGESPLPGTTPTSAWNDQWEQRFAALDLPAEFVAELKAEAMRRGSTDAEIARVYEQVVQRIQGAQGPQSPQGPAGPQGPQQPAADQPGWNPQVEQAFRALGMPDEVLKLYAESGAPLRGLEAAYRHAAGRVQDFTDRGWMQKFTEAGVDPVETWSAILGDAPAKDEDLEKMLAAHKKGQQSIWQKGGQLATSLFPGGRLLQYVFGKEAVSGEKIDRTSPMEIGMAALSGLAAFAAIRGGKNIMAGIRARNAGYAALNGVSDTLAGLGLPKGGVDAMEQAAMGATQTWGAKQKILSFIPGTQLHRQVVGLGHAEAAAHAFNAGGAAKILANDADGALQLATLTQLFDDIKSGATAVHGGSYAYLGPFKKGPITSLGALKDGRDVIKFAKNLGLGGNGNAQLIGMMEVGGAKLGRNPEWLSNAANLIDDVGALAKVERDALGRVMAGNLARELGDIGKAGMRPTKYIQSLASSPTPSWYTSLANATKSQWPTNQMPRELFEALSNHRLYTGFFDDAAAAIAGIDRSALSPEAISMLDDTVAKMDDARVAFEAAKAAGRIGDDVVPAVVHWDAAVGRLLDGEPELAKAVFANYIDEGANKLAQVAARDAIRAEWAAQAATQVDDVVAAVAGRADEAAAVVAGSADDAAAVVAGGGDEAVDAVQALAQGADDVVATPAARPSVGTPTTNHMGTNFTGSPAEWAARDQAEQAARAAATRRLAEAATAEQEAIRAANLARPVNEPVALGVNAAGEAVSPTGLVLPSYTSPVSGPLATATSMDDAARMARMLEQIRNGALAAG